jgi:hypothetical protein
VETEAAKQRWASHFKFTKSCDFQVDSFRLFRDANLFFPHTTTIPPYRSMYTSILCSFSSYHHLHRREYSWWSPKEGFFDFQAYWCVSLLTLASQIFYLPEFIYTANFPIDRTWPIVLSPYYICARILFRGHCQWYVIF